jgi:putative endonuclease
VRLWAWLWGRAGFSGDRAKLGRWGETRAQRFLQGLGYEPIARNWRDGKGELDLVMADGRAIVIVEVKTRCNEDYYPAVAAVNAHKRKVLYRTAKRFLGHYKLSDRPLRFDVVTVIGATGKPEIKHYRNAFVP